jgi:hypothetical protein
LALLGNDAEVFLQSAEVVDVDSYQSKGITKPRKVTLSDGKRTLHAQFKDVDAVHPKIKLSGTIVLRLVDTYRNEIAAYQLDKLLGLGMVPPCVERRIGRDTGSLCMWIEGGFTETERRARGMEPPDFQAYNNQMHDLKLFLQLTWDTDYNNISNIMFDADWKMYKVDSSRAFRTDGMLRRPDALTRFRRSTLEALQGLDEDRFSQSLDPWLSPSAIRALWKRRTAILARANEMVDARGEDAVLFD